MRGRRGALAILAAVGVALALLILNRAERVTFLPDRDLDRAPNLLLPERRMPALYAADANAQRVGWTPDTLFESARGWRAVGDLATAAAYTERALSLAEAREPSWSGRVTALRFRAEIHLETYQWARAGDALVALLDSVDASTSDATWAAFRLGVIRAPLSSDALPWLDLALREPAYANLVNTLRRAVGDPIQVGIALVDAEMWGDAESAFTIALDDPRDVVTTATALAYGGWARDQGGLDGGAWIERAVALAPNLVVVRYLQGLHLRHVGDDRGSLRALIVAAALNPTDPALFAELGTAYGRVGDADSAERWLNEAVRLSRGDPRFSALLGEFRAAHANELRAYVSRLLPMGVELPPDYARNAAR